MRIFYKFPNSLIHIQSYFQSGLGEKGLDINKLEHLFFPTIFLIIFLVFFMSHYFHTESTLHLEQEKTFTYLFIYSVFLRNRSMSAGKGQLISKCLVGNGYLQFSQKTNEKIRLYYYGTSSRIVFVCFLGELKTPKRHFEIN